MIEVLSAGLRLGARELLRGVSFTLGAGELLAILGPNGAGKTSLLRALSGELALTEGAIRINGQPLPDMPRKHLARRRAVMPQADRLSFPLTAAEVVALGRIPHGDNPALDEKIVREVLDAVGAVTLARREYARLSGGERQRVQLARALAQIWEAADETPRYLLLDEPTSSLDLAHQHGVLGLLGRLKRQRIGILVILHDLNLAMRHADRVLLLQAGRVLSCAAPREALTAERLQTVYGLPVRWLETDGALPTIVAG